MAQADTQRVAAGLKTNAKPDVSEKDLDYYNVRENRIKVFERDDYKCRYCGKQLTRFTATLDHAKPLSEGGDNSFDKPAVCMPELQFQKES